MKADSQLNLQHFVNSCNLSLKLYHKINFRLPVLSAFFFDNVIFHKGQNFPVINIFVLKAFAIFLSIDNKFKKMSMGPSLESIQRMKHGEKVESLFLLIIIIL